jgi:hypothetical protein
MMAVAIWSVLMPLMLCVFLLLWYVQDCAVYAWRVDLCMTLWVSVFVELTSSIPPLWPLLVAYLLWIHYIDNSSDHGGRRNPWFRSIRFWRYFADYYPAS